MENDDVSTKPSGTVSRLMATVPYFRESLKIVEPVTGSFVKVSADSQVDYYRTTQCLVPLAFLQAVWTEYLCTLFFLYLATGSIVFGCSTTDTSGGTTGTSGSTGGATG